MMQSKNKVKQPNRLGLYSVIEKCCLAIIIMVAASVFTAKFAQIDNWQWYFFRGAIDLKNSCQVGYQPNGGELVSKSVSIPHKNEEVSKWLPQGDGPLRF